MEGKKVCNNGIYAIDNENYRHELPIVIRDNKHRRGLIAYHSKLKALVKNKIHLTEIQFDNDLYNLINSLWHDAYSKGLAHMDKLHANTEP